MEEKVKNLKVYKQNIEPLGIPFAELPNRIKMCLEKYEKIVTSKLPTYRDKEDNLKGKAKENALHYADLIKDYAESVISKREKAERKKQEEQRKKEEEARQEEERLRLEQEQEEIERLALEDDGRPEDEPEPEPKPKKGGRKPWMVI
jgi:hypothetical protein